MPAQQMGLPMDKDANGHGDYPPLLISVSEELDALPAECRARVIAFYEKLQAQAVGSSAPIMVALLITEISEMHKAAEAQQAAVAQATSEAIADRAAQLAAYEAKIAAIQAKLEKQQWVLGQTNGRFAFLKKPRFRQWAVYLAILALLLGNLSWAAQGKINNHYEACAEAQSFLSSIAAEAHRKKLTAIERFIEIPRTPSGCY